MSLGDAYEVRKTGNYKKALDLYRLVLTEMPDNAKAHEGMAICWLYSKDYTRASIAANQALTFDSSLVTPHLVLMEVYHHQKRSKEAESELNKAIEKDPNSPYVINAQGVSLLWKNKSANAIDVFLKALEVSPDESFAQNVHVSLGYIYWRERKYKQAAQEYKIANELKPSLRRAFTYWVAKYPWLYYLFSYSLVIIFSIALLFVFGMITPRYPLITFMTIVMIVGLLASRMIKRRK